MQLHVDGFPKMTELAAQKTRGKVLTRRVRIAAEMQPYILDELAPANW